MTEELNRTETALLLSLGLAAQAHAGRLAAEAGYADVDTDEVRALAMHIENTLRFVIVAMRQPGPTPTPEEIAETMRIAATGAVVAVLGEPPIPTTGAPN